MKTPETSMPGASARTLRVTAPMTSLACWAESTRKMTLPEDLETHWDSCGSRPSGSPRAAHQAAAAPVVRSSCAVHCSSLVSREEAPTLSRNRGEEKMKRWFPLVSSMTRCIVNSVRTVARLCDPEQSYQTAGWRGECLTREKDALDKDRYAGLAFHSFEHERRQ